MPVFNYPKRVTVETGGGGGGLVAVVVVVVAGVAAVSWLVRELLSIWVELVIIFGGTAVVMGGWLTWMAVKFNRGDLRVDQAAKAEAIAAGRARLAVPAAPAGEVHHHYGEQHIHHHQELHIHQAPPAAEPRPAIAAPKVVPGIVLGTAAPAAIEARKAPLYATTNEHPAPIEDGR